LATGAIARAEQVVDGQVADGQLGGGSGGDPEEPAATSRPRPAGGPTAAAALCEALGVAGRLAWRTDLDVSEALARRATQVAAEHGLLPWRAVAAFQLGMVRMLRTGDTGPVDRARELALDAGMLGQVAAIDYVRSDHAWLVDGPGAGLAIARAADDLVRTLRLPRRAFSPGAIVEALDALDALVTGRATAASTRARDAAVAAERVGGPPLELVLRAVTALVEHDLPAAATELEGTARALLHGSALTPPLVHLGAYALATAAVGAAPAVDVRTAAAAQVRANRGAFAWADAVVHGRAGRPREAAALFAEGDAALAAVPWWRRLLRSVVLGCAVVDGWGDPVPLLRADLAAHEQAGAPGLARTCRDLLRRAGAPTRRRRAGAAVPPRLRARGITAREAEVLGLVVAGLTNAQIAERLFLSSRTVDTHVANLLAKTGAPGRTQLGSWADAAQ
jgi:DNA-binding CsgD family transcriptional regulator